MDTEPGSNHETHNGSQRPTLKQHQSLLESSFPKLSYQYKKGVAERLSGAAVNVRRGWSKGWVRRTSMLVAMLAFFGSGVWAYAAFWPREVPNVADDAFDDVLDYTLLSDDFNQLPLDKRLAIIKDLIARLKGMDSNDSALMSSFAAGIMGKARDQLRKNAEKMAVDMWDAFATDYEKVGRGNRGEYLDKSFVEFTEMMEDVSGFKSGTKPEERLTQGRKQASRDMDRMKDDTTPMRADRVGGFMKMIHERGDALAKPEQRSRMARFSRDMTRNLRNQDVESGKPLTPEQIAERDRKEAERREAEQREKARLEREKLEGKPPAEGTTPPDTKPDTAPPGGR